MVRSRRAKTADRRNLIVGLLILAGVATVSGLAWSMFRQAKREHPTLVAETECPTAGPAGITVVLVDRTDPISPTTQLDLRNRLKDVAARMPKFGKLYLYALDGASAGISQPLFAKCNPGDASTVDALRNNPAKAQQVFEHEFEKPLTASIAELTAANTGAASPIMEAIQDAALTAFTDPDNKGAASKRLIVVSDFMQNSDHVSFYRTAVSRSPAAPQALAAPLEGVEVGLLFIQRPDRSGPSIDELETVWRDYFVQSGVPSGRVRSVKLTGVNP